MANDTFFGQRRIKVESFKEKKTVRVFKSPVLENLGQSIKGAELQWRDRSLTRVQDLSLHGIVADNDLNAKKVRLGQIIEVSLKILNRSENQKLSLLVDRLTPQSAFYKVVTTGIGGTIKIDQPSRDKLLVDNLVNFPGEKLGQALGCKIFDLQWWHGPFDSNFVFGSEVLIFEYDGLLLKKHQGNVKLQRSVFSLNEDLNYEEPWRIDLGQRVGLGNSWFDRLESVIDSLIKNHGLADNLKVGMFNLRSVCV